jgi:hypothetical protein
MLPTDGYCTTTPTCETCLAALIFNNTFTDNFCEIFVSIERIERQLSPMLGHEVTMVQIAYSIFFLSCINDSYNHLTVAKITDH